MQKIVRTLISGEDDRLSMTEVTRRKIGVIKNRKKTTYSKAKYVKDVNVTSVFEVVETRRRRKGPMISPLIDVRIKQRRDLSQDEQYVIHRAIAILKKKGIDHRPSFAK